MKHKIYDEALSDLNEYLDINRIITKLQDIDKLKIILLDEKQRFIFDNIPKPGIRGESLAKCNFTMNRITMTNQKLKFQTESSDSYAFLLNGDPVNSRLFQLLDGPSRRQIKTMGFLNIC